MSGQIVVQCALRDAERRCGLALRQTGSYLSIVSTGSSTSSFTFSRAPRQWDWRRASSAFASLRITSLKLSPGPRRAASLSTTKGSSQTQTSPSLASVARSNATEPIGNRGAERLEGGGRDANADHRRMDIGSGARSREQPVSGISRPLSQANCRVAPYLFPCIALAP